MQGATRPGEAQRGASEQTLLRRGSDETPVASSSVRRGRRVPGTGSTSRSPLRDGRRSTARTISQLDRRVRSQDPPTRCGRRIRLRADSSLVPRRAACRSPTSSRSRSSPRGGLGCCSHRPCGTVTGRPRCGGPCLFSACPLPARAGAIGIVSQMAAALDTARRAGPLVHRTSNPRTCCSKKPVAGRGRTEPRLPVDFVLSKQPWRAGLTRPGQCRQRSTRGPYR